MAGTYHGILGLAFQPPISCTAHAREAALLISGVPVGSIHAQRISSDNVRGTRIARTTREPARRIGSWQLEPRETAKPGTS